MRDAICFESLSRLFAAAVSAAAFVAPLAAQETEPMPPFAPVLAEVRFTHATVRPGGRLGVTYVWRNDGGPTDQDYMVFAHFEHPGRDCAHIVFQQDHFPLVATRTWERGRAIEDGPYSVPVPVEAAEGNYAVHVGLWQPATGARVCDTYRGLVTVSASPPPPAKPLPAPAAAIARAAAALDARLTSPQTIDSDAIAFTVSADNGSYRLLDKRSGAVWRSSPFAEGLGDAQVRLASGRTKSLRLGKPSRISRGARELTLQYEMPEAGRRWRLTVTARLVADPRSLELCWATSGEGAQLTAITLLADAPWATAAGGGYVVVPSRLGMLLPADSGEAYVERFDTYTTGGCQMQMLGAVEGGSAALVTWQDVYGLASVKSIVGEKPAEPWGQLVAMSLRLQTPGSKARITLLGRGGYVEMAQAYRDTARENGWLMTWAEKEKRWPALEAQKLLGAPDIKPFVLSRTVKSSRYYSGPPQATEATYIGYTFDEAAQIAEHLRRDVGVDKALFVLAGWIHRGYDNQHPDILPAAPECGGNDALVNAAARIRRLGYLFGLHDNYEDMYRDAPSWSDVPIIKRRDGRLLAGGNWAGGQAWLVCSQEGLKYAARPQQNMPRVKELFRPSAYFIDTTFAAELLECFDPAHPLTRWDDMKYKSALSDFSMGLFGAHGSEEGMEWAVPHAAYFEGIASASGDPPYGWRIPLFELVYHDCIALYPHQGDRAYPNRPDYIVRLIGLGRMPLYGFGPHLYWKTEGGETVRATVAVERLDQTGPRAFDIWYRWTVAKEVKGDWRAFTHFTRSNGDIAFQGDHAPNPATTTWRAGQQVVIGPIRVEVPAGLEGAFDIRSGLFKLAGGERALLADSDDGMRRYTIGRVRIGRAGAQTRIALEPRDRPRLDALCLARADGRPPDDLCLTDRFIRNTYEVMSPLAQLTARLPMTAHQFLTPDRRVQRTVFGDDVEVIVNLSGENCRTATAGGEALLPPFGFSIWAPQFRAFHALSWQGIEYRSPALFAIRAMDGHPIESSRKLRIFHGFGETAVRVRGETYTVDAERVIAGGD